MATESHPGTSSSGPFWALQVTEADHEANVFRTLGGAAWKTKRERDAAFAAIPTSPTADAATDAFSYMVDVLDKDGFSIVTDREVDQATALALLGEDSIEELRAHADEREAEGRRLAEEFIAERAVA